MLGERPPVSIPHGEHEQHSPVATKVQTLFIAITFNLNMSLAVHTIHNYYTSNVLFYVFNTSYIVRKYLATDLQLHAMIVSMH